MKLTDAEWVVMNALWAEQPATARQVACHLPAEVSWAYTTLKTLLTRLVEKEAVREKKVGNTSVYESRLSRKRARQGALKSLINQAFDGAFGPLMHFLIDEKNLTVGQRRELKEALAALDKPAARRGKKRQR